MYGVSYGRLPLFIKVCGGASPSCRRNPLTIGRGGSQAHNFPVWAEHTSAMHQYAIWNALAALNIGANLQHYNGVIDEKVAETWNIDSNWKLIAQMVFGGIAAPAGEKTFEPIEKRLKVYGK